MNVHIVWLNVLTVIKYINVMNLEIIFKFVKCFQEAVKYVE